MSNGPVDRPPRPRRVLTGSMVSWSVITGVLLLAALVGIAWRATDVLWFLLFPLLLAGVLVATAMGVLWGLRHF